MRNIAIIVLSVLLAAAIVIGSILYGKYSNRTDALQTSEQESLDLNERVAQLNKEIAALKDQTRQDAKRLKELKSAKERVSDLEEKRHNLERSLEGEKKTAADLSSQLSSKDAMLLQLREKLDDSLNRVQDLENEIAQAQRRNVQLQSNLGQEKKATGQLSAQLSSKDALLAQTQEELGKAISRTRNLESEIAEAKRQGDRLRINLEEEKKITGELSSRLSSKDVTLAQLQAGLDEIVEGQRQKEQRLSEPEEGLRESKGSIKEEEKITGELGSQLSSKDATLVQLQARLDEIVEGQRQKEQRLLDLEDQLRESKGSIEEEEKIAGELRSQLSSKDATLAQLRQDLEDSQSRIQYLENQITGGYHQTPPSPSEAKKDFSKPEGGDETKKTPEPTSAELSAKVARLAQLQKELKDSRSHIRYLEGEISKGQGEIEDLHLTLSDIKGQKALAESKVSEVASTYEALISDLKKQIENQEVTIEAFKEKISVTFMDRILFDFGKATVSPEGREILERVGKTLRDVKDKKIRVIGHTDDIPITAGYQHKFPSNWELSAARASAVVRYFQTQIGLDPRNLEAVGCSFYRPIASNETEEGRAQNRRVNIVIAPELEPQ